MQRRMNGNARVSLVAIGLIGLVACGGGGGGERSGYTAGERDEYGNCYGEPGQTCTGYSEYESCVKTNCGSLLSKARSDCAQVIDCFKGCECSDISCEQQCLMSNVTPECSQSDSQLISCMQSAGCKEPECSSAN